jgi:hypothetical protein
MVIRREGIARTVNPETTQIAYGLGWVVQDYRGRTMLLHGGSIDGARVQFTLVPEARLGIAILTNLEGHYGNLAMSNQLVDRFLGVETRDWMKFFHDIEEQELDVLREQSKKLQRERRHGSAPPLPLSAYVGSYEDAAYGAFDVKLHEGRLHASWGDLRSPLDHLSGNRFLANEPPLQDAVFEFRVRDGNITSLKTLDREFTRAPK